MLFKTNAKCGGCKNAILSEMNKRFPDAQWDLDLDSTDKVLEVHGLPENAETAAQVEKAIEETGSEGAWIRR